MSKFDMDWGSVKESGTGGNVDFIKLQNGVNPMRIVGKPSLIDIHWEEGVDGSKKKVICPGPGCPICKAGNSPQSRYQIQVIDRVDGKVKVLEGGPTIFNAIKAYAMDPEYGDPTRYDIRIKKEGTGRETKYTVVPSPNKTGLTDAERAAVDSSKTLAEINKAKTIDEILQLGLKCLMDSVSDLEMNFPDEMPSGDISNDAWDNL